MNQPFDYSRFDWYPIITHNGVTFGPGRVLMSNGAMRPALRVPLKIFTVHYGGAGQWLDPGDTDRELAAIERNHAIPKEKPNEYNSASDSDAATWEWAGRFRAAHSSGNNDTAWGHLVVYGLEMPTEAQADKLIEGVRRARRQAVDAGYLTPDHAVEPHQNMPGARTPCPGPIYNNRIWWSRISAPLEVVPEPPAPPVIPPSGAPDMFFFVVTNAPGSEVPETWLLCDGTQLAHVVDGHAAAVFAAADVPVVRAANADQTRGLIKSCKTMNPCPAEWEDTGWETLWNRSR